MSAGSSLGRSEGWKEERAEALRWTAILESVERLGVMTEAGSESAVSSSSVWRAEGPKDLRRLVDLRGLFGRLIADSVAVRSAEGSGYRLGRVRDFVRSSRRTLVAD